MLTAEPDAPIDERTRTDRPAPLVRTRSKSRVRRALHRAFVAKRAPVVKVHRWLSFLLLGWLVLEGLTGAAIVFGPELDHVWNRDRFTPTAGDVGPAEAISAARQASPDQVVSFVSTPSSDTGGMYVVYLTDASAEFHATVVDPGTGEPTAVDHHPPRLLALAEELHVDLNSTSIFGFEPLSVMGWMSVLWLVVIITGAYLWYWPGVKRWARAVKVRRRRGRFTFHLDLHKALGLLTVVPLTLVVVTAIDFAFPKQVADVWEVVTFGTYDPDAEGPVATSEPVAGATPITADEAQAIVERVDPGLEVRSVTTPGGSPVGVWEVSALADGAFLDTLGGARYVEFSVDQYSGRIRAIADPRDQGFANAAYDEWSYQVHFGTIGGTTTRALWVGLGLAPLGLGTTGTVMWFVRRNKRRRRTDRSSAGIEAPTTDDPAEDATTTTADNTDNATDTEAMPTHTTEDAP